MLLDNLLLAVESDILDPLSLFLLTDQLPLVPINRKADLPGIAAIYFVKDYKEVVYIGQTGDLKTRFGSHHLIEDFRACNANVSWLDPKDNDILTLEKKLINAVKPRLNKAGIESTTPNKISKLLAFRAPLHIAQAITDLSLASGKSLTEIMIEALALKLSLPVAPLSPIEQRLALLEAQMSKLVQLI